MVRVFDKNSIMMQLPQYQIAKLQQNLRVFIDLCKNINLKIDELSEKSEAHLFKLILERAFSYAINSVEFQLQPLILIAFDLLGKIERIRIKTLAGLLGNQIFIYNQGLSLANRMIHHTLIQHYRLIVFHKGFILHFSKLVNVFFPEIIDQDTHQFLHNIADLVVFVHEIVQNSLNKLFFVAFA